MDRFYFGSCCAAPVILNGLDTNHLLGTTQPTMPSVTSQAPHHHVTEVNINNIDDVTVTTQSTMISTPEISSQTPAVTGEPK